MKKVGYALILFAVGLAFWLVGFGVQPPSKADRLQITTSFYPLYFFSKEIVGDKATVVNITPAGAEPHDYDLTPGDRVRIEQSALLVLNGGLLEPWGQNIREALRRSSTTVIEAGSALAIDQIQGGNGTTGVDPHVWLSPVLAKQEAAAIYSAVSKIDSANASYYSARAGELFKKFDDLDQEYRLDLRNCQKKDFVTSHAAFGYLAKSYGLNQVSISGLSPDEEPSPQTLARTTDFIKQNKIKYVFFESLVSPRLAETIADAAGARVLVLNPIEGFTPAEISAGKTYFSEMENNLTNLKIALECH